MMRRNVQGLGPVSTGRFSTISYFVYSFILKISIESFAPLNLKDIDYCKYMNVNLEKGNTHIHTNVTSGRDAGYTFFDVLVLKNFSLLSNVSPF